MRYRYFGALCGRKVFSLVLIVCMLPAVISTGGSALRRSITAVKKGVTFQGGDMGGMLPEEVRTVVQSVADMLRVPAVNAEVDEVTGGVVPGLDGSFVDVEGTVAAILAAKKGERTEPLLKTLKAAVTLADFPQKPVYRGNPAKNQVTFLVNVAWGNEFLPELLQVLKEAEAKATFFLVGRWVRQYPDLARSISEAGFELANHGDSDAVSMAKLGLEDCREQIRAGAGEIYRACGVRPHYFSPHRGELTETVLRAAALENSRVVMWTVDTVDWKLPGVPWMLDKVLDQAAGGSLILMHPTAQTAEFLKQVIPELRQRGLEPVSLSELLSPARPPDKGAKAR